MFRVLGLGCGVSGLRVVGVRGARSGLMQELK